MAILFGCSMPERSGLAQDADAPPLDTGAVTAALHPRTCRALLEARHVTFTFTPPVAEGDCGIALPVRLRSVAIDGNDIAFGAEPVLDCRMAVRLADWIGNVVEPLARHHLGSGLAAIETGPGYVCRKRNNAATGKLSEHAKGNAVDIAAFAVRDGRRIAVRPEDRPPLPVTTFLAAVRSTACGYFLTVLGPGADASHAEHLHLDLAPRGETGFRICE
ncbi:extensin-like domain-containing protein [Dongia sedimenti]|uniref:Extensin family protein n=1 Tax=Dongia sedimenti TaxID=3064282 RepID=A0ABU0YK54_9PROT|nr:extensin family protein [Rhodospirillaceae bacterium R-7]